MFLAAMASSRSSNHYHNFKTTSTPWLAWGNTRFLRCQKVNSSSAAADNHCASGRSSAADTDYFLGSNKRKRGRDIYFERSKNANSSIVKEADFDDFEGIEAVREKLTFDLKTAAADNMKFTILKHGGDDDVAVEERPWNLRTRRAACKSPIANVKNSSSSKPEEKKAVENVVKSSRLRVIGEEKERAKFAVSLSRKEIEEDYAEMIGERPPRRPKKRPKAVQKQLDTIFPGLWMTEVTPDMYKVSEFPESKRR